MNQLQELQETVDKVFSHQPQPETRVLRRIEVGQAIHQADVYLHRVADDHPRGELMPGERQVAVGATVGARHYAEGDKVQLFQGRALPPTFVPPKWAKSLSKADIHRIFLGPVVTGARKLTHPEHAHHCFPEHTYQVTFQGDERTAERVRD